MITVEGLTKSFDDNLIFHDVDFHVNKGDTLVIIGGSGCGKSTLLRCLNRLDVPDSGRVLIEGQDILAPGADVDGIRRKMGMVYQQFNLFSHLNVMENIILAPMKVAGLPQEQAIAEAEELLRLVGLEGRKYHMPNQLSGGQKQRAAIARTLAMKPGIILFDEPTSALDPTMVDEVESVIRNLVNEGMTSVIVTHEMRFARKVASHVIFMADQGIYEEGPAAEVFDRPARELTRQFLYRSRLFQIDVVRAETDRFALFTKIVSYAIPFGLSARQRTCLEHFLDELVFALVDSGDPSVEHVVFRMVCSEDERGHQVMVEFPGAKADPLEHPVLDEISLAMLRGFSRDLQSRKNGDGNWEVEAIV